MHRTQIPSNATRDTAGTTTALSTLIRHLVRDAALLVVVLDRDLRVTFANAHAEMTLANADGTLTGAAFATLLENHDISQAHRLAEAARSGRRTRLETVRVEVGDRPTFLDFSIEPATSESGDAITLIVGHDVTAREGAQDALRERARVLQEAVEELQTANEELHSANEELVTANEDLQSSNEELATLNEEFQTTNEELQTANAALLATNGELGAANRTLDHAAREAKDLHTLLDTLSHSLRDAFFILDASERVTHWSQTAAHLLGRSATDVLGQNIFDIGLTQEAALIHDLLANTDAKNTSSTSPAIDIDWPLAATGSFEVIALVAPTTDRVSGWLFVFHDERRHKQLENDLPAAKTRR